MMLVALLLLHGLQEQSEVRPYNLPRLYYGCSWLGAQNKGPVVFGVAGSQMDNEFVVAKFPHEAWPKETIVIRNGLRLVSFDKQANIAVFVVSGEAAGEHYDIDFKLQMPAQDDPEGMLKSTASLVVRGKDVKSAGKCARVPPPPGEPK